MYDIDIFTLCFVRDLHLQYNADDPQGLFMFKVSSKVPQCQYFDITI